MTTSAVPDASAEWAVIQTLLARSVNYPDWFRNRPRMREVPRLSPETEARLIALYGQTNRLWPKQFILRILAFGGGRASAALLRRVLTEEFAGQEVLPGESTQLEYLPQLIGILARHDDDALAFLVEGSRPGYWENRPLWKPSGDSPETHPEALVGACIVGLALSGRPEYEAMLDWYRQHPEALFIRNSKGVLGGGSSWILDAEFKRALVREMGIEAAMDEVIYDPGGVMFPRYLRWRDSPEGKGVAEYWSRLAELGSARLKAARSSKK